MKTNIFNEKLNKDFMSNYFGKQYLHKKEMFENTSNIMSLDILNNILGISSNWNNKNFIYDNFLSTYLIHTLFFLELLQRRC